MPNNEQPKKPRGGFRQNAKRPNKYTTELVKYSHWIPKPSKPLFDELLRSEREKYLITAKTKKP